MCIVPQQTNFKQGDYVVSLKSGIVRVIEKITDEGAYFSNIWNYWGAHDLSNYRKLEPHEITRDIKKTYNAVTYLYCRCTDSDVTHEHYYIIKGDQHGYRCAYCDKEELGPHPEDFNALFAKEIEAANEPMEPLSIKGQMKRDRYWNR